jgi:hypothetical protein
MELEEFLGGPLPRKEEPEARKQRIRELRKRIGGKRYETEAKWREALARILKQIEG